MFRRQSSRNKRCYQDAHGQNGLNITEIKDEVRSLAKKNENDNEAMSRRISSLEEDIKRMKYVKMKSPDRSPVKVSDMQVLPVVDKEDKERNSQKTSQTVGRQGRTSQPQGKSEQSNQQQMQSSWREDRNKDLETAAHLAGWTDGQKEHYQRFAPVNWFSPIKKKETTRRAPKEIKDNFKNCFGDEDNISDSSPDVSEEENDKEKEEEWDHVDRTVKNRMKKKLKKQKVKTLQMETSMKARDMIGVGPIKNEDVENRMNEEVDYEEAKMLELQNYLMCALQFEEWEIGSLGIIGTKMARDNVMYLAVKDHDAIR